MSMRTGKHEMGIMASLDVRAESCFDIGIISIFRDLLKFVNGNQARLVGMVQVMEDFIQCGDWIGDGT